MSADDSIEAEQSKYMLWMGTIQRQMDQKEWQNGHHENGQIRPVTGKT